ncbi:hypothetical protein [Paenibacillus terrae]|uniref:Uncharacterized protein n=1 Tax=Paenibacillus terrae TaxID=159743 RepID=A0A0D7X5Y8_9BACL|nr:hypothetical protein [Paenibacillus terrae]KJD46800.1 hypothetical protein QD47_04640 [Paenibacillus terrae]
MNINLKTFIESKIPFEEFTSTRLIDSEESLRWIPIISYGEHQTIIGLSRDAKWVIKEKEGLRILDETWKFLRLLVLLEQPRKKLVESLEEALGNYEIIVNVDEIFPFVEIVKIGFEQKSDYWVELALNWFAELPLIKQKLLLESLIDIVNARWASQMLRHRAKKILRNIQ